MPAVGRDQQSAGKIAGSMEQSGDFEDACQTVFHIGGAAAADNVGIALRWGVGDINMVEMAGQL